jgi:hypothetical protein
MEWNEASVEMMVEIESAGEGATLNQSCLLLLFFCGLSMQRASSVLKSASTCFCDHAE